jgi:hypothetical protein
MNQALSQATPCYIQLLKWSVLHALLLLLIFTAETSSLTPYKSTYIWVVSFSDIGKVAGSPEGFIVLFSL